MPPTTCTSIPARRDPARDQRRRRARVRRVDVERRRNEEEEAAAAFDDDDLAAARAEHVEADAPELGVLLRGDALVEAFALDRDRDVAGRERDAARVRVLAGLQRIVVCAREQAVPERAAPSAAAAGLAREFDGDLRGRQAHHGRRDRRLPCRGGRSRASPSARRRPESGTRGAGIGRGLERDAVLAFVAWPDRVGREQVADRGRHRPVLAGGEAEVLPLGVLDQDRGVDRRRQVGRQGLGAAAGRGDARQRFGEGQQRIDPVAANATGMRRFSVVHGYRFPRCGGRSPVA